MRRRDGRGVVFAVMLAIAGGVVAGPIDLDDARLALDEAKRLSEADGGTLWGRPMYGAIILVDPATRFAVANRRDAERRLTPQGEGLFTGTLPAEVAIANTSIEWAGRRWSMIMWPLPGDPKWRGALLMHECFHRVQVDLGLPLSVADNHHLDTPAGRLWLRLEWRALAAALEAEDPQETVAARDALVFRAYRQSLFKRARVEERMVELNEGLAEYTGIRLSGMTADEQRRAAVGALRRADGAPSVVRSFAYASGPPYGMLLDIAQPAWRSDVDKSTDFGRTLQRAVRFRPPGRKTLEDEARTRGIRYDSDEISAQEAERNAVRQTRLDAMRARFVDGPVLLLDLTGNINFNFNPHDIHALDGVGTVYGSLRLAGPFGILDAPGGALIIEMKRGKKRLSLPAPDDPGARPLRGDGWTFKLAPGYRVGAGPRDGSYMIEPQP